MLTALHDATLGSIARGVYLLRYGTQYQKERIQRLVALVHHCHHAFFVTKAFTDYLVMIIVLAVTTTALTGVA